MAVQGEEAIAPDQNKAKISIEQAQIKSKQEISCFRSCEYADSDSLRKDRYCSNLSRSNRIIASRTSDCQSQF